VKGFTIEPWLAVWISRDFSLWTRCIVGGGPNGSPGHLGGLLQSRRM